MQHVLSTRLLSNHRLTTVWLNRIWDAEIPFIEFYCARQHLDYRDKAQIGELGHWFRDAKLKVHSAHSPIHNDGARGLSGPSSLVSITEPTKGKRIQMVDEIKRAIEVSETIPFTYLIQHMGTEFEEFDERKIDAAFTALEELNIFARQRGVEILLENMNSGMASAEKLYYFNSVTHMNLKYCLDTGQAHLGDGVEAALEVMKPNVRIVHVHDNNGKEDSHLLPMAGSVDWQKVMQLVRRDAPDAALVLEASERHESPNPLDDARRVFENLENLKSREEEDREKRER
jgi:sugar phosphate isomerase/epimerase